MDINCVPVVSNYIFWSFGISVSILSHFENRILLKPVQGDVAGVGHFILLVLNELSEFFIFFFYFFCVFLAYKGSNYLQLFVSVLL